MYDDIEQAVLRIHLADDPNGVVGTAFMVAPGLAITCAHVLTGIQPSRLKLAGKSGNFLVGNVELAPDPGQIDLALLAIAGPAPVLLACTGLRHEPLRLVARGYSLGIPGDGGRELHFSPRRRVEAQYAEYTISEAFDLAGDVAERGFSGSPLFDPDCGCVIGILSGGDRGRERSWAVPLFNASQVWPALGEALAWNNENKPRFGAVVNELGAALACRVQLEHELGRMRHIKNYNPALSVVRKTTNEHVDRFCNTADAVALAVVGGSNTGKTWFLCDAAQSSSITPMMLLSAADLARNDPPFLRDFIALSIGAAWAKRARTEMPPSPERISETLASSRPLVIALDGINEALDVRHFLNRWLQDAIGWCRDHRAKLLFTTRPEPWPAIARAIPDPEMLFRTETVQADRIVLAENRRVWLGDFTIEEAKEATSQYQLDFRIVDSLGRHPLMFRVAAELGLNAPEAMVGRYRLLDHFVNKQIDDATAQLGARPSPAMLRRVRSLAASLSDDGSVALGIAIDALIGEEELDALVDAGLLSRTAAAIRFTYDQVGEVMMPPPSEVNSLFLPDAINNPRMFRRSIIGLLRLEADGSEVEFSTGLERLRSAFEDGSIVPSNFWLKSIDGLSYLLLSLPASRAEEAGIVLNLLLAYSTEFAQERQVPWLISLVEMAPVTPSRKVEMLLSLAPWGDSWPFRYKDWTDDTRRDSFKNAVNSTTSRSVAGALDRVYVSNPTIVRSLLVDALDDETR